MTELDSDTGNIRGRSLNSIILLVLKDGSWDGGLLCRKQHSPT
jgi:hypothetical protein